MSLLRILGVQMFADLLSTGFRQRRYDIEKLVSVARRAGNQDLAQLLTRLSDDLPKEKGLARIAERIGASLAFACRRAAAENLAWSWGIDGARLRGAGADGAARGADKPAATCTIVPTLQCNLRCPNCPCARAPLSAGDSAAEMERVLREARAMGRGLVVVAGGEPFLAADRLFQVLAAHRDLYFLILSNGTLIDRALARKLAQAGNACIVLTMVGGRDRTDARRGPGAFLLAAKGMQALHREGVPFGVLPVGPGADASRFMGDDFMRNILRRGALFAWLTGGKPGMAWQVMERHPLLVFHVSEATTASHACASLAAPQDWTAMPAHSVPVA